MIVIKNDEQIAGIKASARLLSKVFARVGALVAPGVSTLELDAEIRSAISESGGIPAFLGYGGFPAAVCASVNQQVIHGIPNRRVLEEGDIVGCDIGVLLDGYYSDACRTYPVGSIAAGTAKLLDVTEKSLYAAIAACGPGARVKDIGKAVTETVSPHGYGIVRSYCGHGVGLELHEDPQVPNYYPSRGLNARLKPGMVIAIEPMINAGTADVVLLDDDWTVETADGSLSAHFEHTVLITETGSEILTSWRD